MPKRKVVDRSKITVSQFLNGKVNLRGGHLRGAEFLEADAKIRHNLALSLEDVRAKLRLSKLKFCKEIGICHRVYLRIVKGEKSMSIANLVILSRKTGYGIQRLIGIKEDGYFNDVVE